MRRWPEHHPFALSARHARGEVLRVEPLSPPLHSETIGDVASVDLVATRDPETGDTTVFAVNRSDDDPADLRLRLVDGRGLEVVDHTVLGGGDLLATNSKAAPNRVLPRASDRHRFEGDVLHVELPAVSWTMVRLASARRD